MKGLNKTEITGLALLGAVVVGVTVGGILAKGCRREMPPISVEAVATETPETPDTISDKQAETPEKTEKKKSRRKKTAAPKKVPTERSDPFADTITRY